MNLMFWKKEKALDDLPPMTIDEMLVDVHHLSGKKQKLHIQRLRKECQRKGADTEIDLNTMSIFLLIADNERMGKNNSFYQLFMVILGLYSLTITYALLKIALSQVN